VPGEQELATIDNASQQTRVRKKKKKKIGNWAQVANNALESPVMQA
jgi:hypothetical protein